MTQADWKPRVEGIIDILPQEIDEFESEASRFQAGEFDPIAFQSFRLKQGVYGQRQADVQMMRIKVPFGGLKADQLDALGEVAARYAPLNKGHVTTRENFQYHHIPLADTAAFMRVLADVGLSTREACGNTVRNVTGCDMAGVCADEPFDVTPYAAAYSRYFVRHPFTQALPRKWKTAFSGCERDCSITAIHDMGFIPKVVDGKKGFKLLTGGGTSIMPRIAPTLAEFVPEEEYLKYTDAAIRDFHRSDELRKNKMKARIKFFIDRIGMDEFRGMVEEEMQQQWAQKSFDPTSLLFLDDESADAPSLDGNYSVKAHGGEYDKWVESNVRSQKQAGYKAVTVKLPLGDIQAEQFPQLAELSRKYAGSRARITQQQNLTFRWVPEAALSELYDELNKIGLGDSGAHEISDVVSCPGTDSCKLGITSSMGLGRVVGEALEGVDSSDPLIRKMHVKMSGCPNGCGQHHIADIGFHGAAAKAPGGQVPAYEMFLGGSYEDGDTRIGLRVKTKVPAKRVPEALKVVMGHYQKNRNEDEPFKDYVARVGPETFEPLLADFKDLPELGRDTIEQYMDWDKTIIYKLDRGEGECSV